MFHLHQCILGIQLGLVVHLLNSPLYSVFYIHLGSYSGSVDKGGTCKIKPEQK